MRDQAAITDAEWRVMHEIWRLEEQQPESTSRDIIDQLSQKTEWSDGTIKTLLHRLVQKRVLNFQRKGNRYLYRSNQTEQECVDQVCNQLLHTVFNGQPVPMLQYLVRASRLSGREVETLHEILQHVRRSLPPQTPRNVCVYEESVDR